MRRAPSSNARMIRGRFWHFLAFFTWKGQRMRKQRSSLGVVRRGLSPSQALDSPNLGAHKGGRENTAAPKVERGRHLSETIGIVLIVTVLAWIALIWVAVAHADDFICRQAVCTGTPSGDFIEGDDHANTIRGKAGADHLFGERGWDPLEGGRGWDEVDGGYGQGPLRRGGGGG